MKRTTRIFLSLIVILIAALFATSCSFVQGNLSADVPAPCTDTEGTVGEVIYGVYPMEQLPENMEWKVIGGVDNPTSFDLVVDGQPITVTFVWEDADTVDMSFSNHTRRPAFTYSQEYKNAWAVTDGIWAKSYLEDPAGQYALLGYKGEAAFFIAYIDDLWRVALAPKEWCN